MTTCQHHAGVSVQGCVFCQLERAEERLDNATHVRDMALAANERAEEQRAKLIGVMSLIACGPRPDGTYNRCREACEKLAKDVLKEVER